MSGGIARFARKPAAAAVATAADAEGQKESVVMEEFVGGFGGGDDASFGGFGANDFGDGRNTPSGGDDFGFMGGGDSTVGVHFEFMGDGGFNEDGLEEDNSMGMALVEVRVRYIRASVQKSAFPCHLLRLK